MDPIIAALLGGMISPAILKLVDHFVGRRTRHFSREKSLRDELWGELNTLRSRLNAVEESNDELVIKNAELRGQIAQQDIQIADLRQQLSNVLLERDHLKQRVQELETLLSDFLAQREAD